MGTAEESLRPEHEHDHQDEDAERVRVGKRAGRIREEGGEQIFRLAEEEARLRENFPRVARVILDFFHPAEKLTALSRSLHPKDEGQAEEQARIARQNGVQIDVVPIAAARKSANEVLVERIEAPPYTDKDARVPLRVILRSYHPDVVVGTLTVKQTSEGHSSDVPGSPKKNVALQPGLNSFTFKQPLSSEQRSYTYEAEFLPEAVFKQEGRNLVQIAKGLPGDRPQNNRATTHVVARGQRRILLIEPHAGDHQYLVSQLASSTAKFQVDTIEVEKLPPDKDKLAVLFSNYDCVILANVAASVSGSGRTGSSRTPSACATALGTRAGSARLARSTSQMPSG